MRDKIKQTAEIKDRIKKNTHREKEDEEPEETEQKLDEDDFFNTDDIVHRQKKKKVLISGDIEDEKVNKKFKRNKKY